MGNNYKPPKPRNRESAAIRTYVMDPDLAWLRSCITAGRIVLVPFEQQFDPYSPSSLSLTPKAGQLSPHVAGKKVAGAKRVLNETHSSRKKKTVTQTKQRGADETESDYEDIEDEYRENTDVNDNSITHDTILLESDTPRKRARQNKISPCEPIADANNKEGEEGTETLSYEELKMKYRKVKKDLHRRRRKYDKLWDKFEQNSTELQDLRTQLTIVTNQAETMDKNYSSSKIWLEEKGKKLAGELSQSEALVRRTQLRLEKLELQRETEGAILSAVRKELDTVYKKFESTPSAEVVESALRDAAKAHREIQDLKREHARELSAAQHDIEVMSGNVAWLSVGSSSAAAAVAAENGPADQKTTGEHKQVYQRRMAYKFSIAFMEAESHFYKSLAHMDGYKHLKFIVEKVELVTNKRLQEQFGRSMCYFYTKGYPAIIETMYHGTDPANIEGILSDNMKMNVARKLDDGWFGRGFYFSKHADYTFMYNTTGSTRLVTAGDRFAILRFDILPGRQETIPHVHVGVARTLFKDSHVSPNGFEQVMFDPRHVCPTHVIHLSVVNAPGRSFIGSAEEGHDPTAVAAATTEIPEGVATPDGAGFAPTSPSYSPVSPTPQDCSDANDANEEHHTTAADASHSPTSPSYIPTPPTSDKEMQADCDAAASTHFPAIPCKSTTMSGCEDVAKGLTDKANSTLASYSPINKTKIYKKCSAAAAAAATEETTYTSHSTSGAADMDASTALSSSSTKSKLKSSQQPASNNYPNSWAAMDAFMNEM